MNLMILMMITGTIMVNDIPDDNSIDRFGVAPSQPPAIPPGPGVTRVLFSQFFKNLYEVIFRPKAFFEKKAGAILSSDGLASALAFAVIVSWIGAVFNFFWTSAIGFFIAPKVQDLFQITTDVFSTPMGRVNHQYFINLEEQLFSLIFGAGSVILTPFLTLFRIAFYALFVHFAVRFVMKEQADRPHSYGATLKIVAYGLGPVILTLIPGIGFILGWILTFVSTTIGFREVYRTTQTRALFAVSFPALLGLILAFLVVILVVILALNFAQLFF